MKNRRVFLQSFAPIAAAIVLPTKSMAQEDPQEDLCQFHADGLAAAMQEKYGGNWRIALNPAGGAIFGRRMA